MLGKLLANTIYVQIRKNTFRVRHIEGNKEYSVVASKPFTTTRLLVGQFQEAASLLKNAIREVTGSRLFQASPIIIVHPLEFVEGGLSEVENRLFRELAISAGARNVVVHVGLALTDSEVVSLVQKKQNGV